jgi:hypothetical protein
MGIASVPSKDLTQMVRHPLAASTIPTHVCTAQHMDRHPFSGSTYNKSAIIRRARVWPPTEIAEHHIPTHEVSNPLYNLSDVSRVL